MNKKQTIICLLLLFLLAGCASATVAVPDSKPSHPAQSAGTHILTGLVRGNLANYSAAFEIRFTGPVSWLYRLESKKGPALLEESLHLEGIDKSNNPGDIRSVTDGKTTWMIGPGTDNECVQFPNGQGMDPSYVYPETLVSFQDLYNSLSFLGEDTTAGQASEHFGAARPTIGHWKDARIDVWQLKSSGELLRFTMQGSGSDSIFGTGEGKIVASYEVLDLKQAAIAPVAGCNIDVPLPDSAKLFVRLPGLASFESAESVNQIAGFYETELPKQNWSQSAPPDLSNGSAVLSYRRDAESVEIQINPESSGGCRVKLIFQQAN